MEGGSCEATHQKHLLCSDGTMSLSPEQTSPSKVLPTSNSITQPFVEPGREMTCDRSGNQQLCADMREASGIHHCSGSSAASPLSASPRKGECLM